MIKAKASLERRRERIDDFTWRERKVMDKKGGGKRKEKEEEMRVGYMKMWVNGNLRRWDE